MRPHVPRRWRGVLLIAAALFASNLALAGSAAAQSEIEPIRVIDTFSIPAGTTVLETPLGGLSGIDYDPVAGAYWAISDDRSQNAAARFYGLTVDYDEGGFASDPVEFISVTSLRDQGGDEFGLKTVDPEAIRFDASAGSFYWTSEGASSDGIAAFVWEMDPGGGFVREFSVPDYYQPVTPQVGVRNNQAFEGLSLSVDGDTVVAAVENALVQDGPRASYTSPSPSRFLLLDKSSGTASSEYVYYVDPVLSEPTAPLWPGGPFASDRGLVEILALNSTDFLAIERSFASGVGFQIRVYWTTTLGATEVGAKAGLDGTELPMTKRLLVDFDAAGIPTDNIEGITWGPTLGNGSRSLLLVADDNFGFMGSATQFIALEVPEGSIPIQSGDVDGDGELTRSDRQLVAEKRTDGADIDGNGAVDSDDRRLWDAFYAELSQPHSTPVWVSGFVLVDPATDEILGPLDDGDVIRVPAGGFNVKADVFAEPHVGRVMWFLDGASLGADSKPPFAAGSERSGDYGPLALSPGIHTISAIAVSSPPGTPLSSEPLTVTFEIPDYELTVLHHNDGESDLLGDGEYGGAARFASLAQSLHDAAESGDRRGAVLVSAGDNFLSGVEFNASLTKGAPYYDTILLDHLPYASITLGNHDFDFGPDILAEFIGGFEGATPFISANLDVSAEPSLAALASAGRIRSSVIVDRDGRRIGIVGATTPELPFLSAPRNVVALPDVAGLVQAEVDRLTADGVSIVVVVSHLQGLEVEQALVPQLRSVDAFVAGGGDEVLANAGDLLVPPDEAFGPYPLLVADADGVEVPVVVGQGNYRYVGELVLLFDDEGRVVDVVTESGPRRVSAVAPDAVDPDPFVVANVEEPVRSAIDGLAENILATSEVALDVLRSHVRTQETNGGNLVADAVLWKAQQLAGDFGAHVPQVGVQNGGSLRSDRVHPAGLISELDTFDIAPFGGSVTIVEDITPQRMKQVLENAYSQIEIVKGRFAQISGLTVEVDPDGIAQIIDGDTGVVTVEGTRVVRAVLDGGQVLVSGGVIQPGAPTVDLALISFLAGGGDQYPLADLPSVRLGVTYQAALADYLVDGLGGAVTASDYPEGGEGRILFIP